MKKTTAGAVVCMVALMTAGYASADSALGQLPGSDSGIAGVPAVKAEKARATVTYPIAAAEKACLDGAMSTMAMQICLKQTYDNWDAKLNKAYGGLMKELDPKAAASLRNAQRAWLAYRDANETFLMMHYDPVQMGSEGKLVVMDIKTQVVRERALTLQNRLGLYDGSGGAPVDETSTPTDAALSACMDQDPGTAGQVNCIGKASREFETEMDKASAALKGSTQAAEELETARQAWATFRSAELTAIQGVYGGLQGTMYIPMAADSEMQIVRQRVLVLQAIQSL